MTLQCLLSRQLNSASNAYSVLADGFEELLKAGPVLTVERGSDDPPQHISAWPWTGLLSEHCEGCTGMKYPENVGASTAAEDGPCEAHNVSDQGGQDCCLRVTVPEVARV